MACRLIGLAVACVLVLPGVARADFFDDARKTFTKDIPHFFQDDVPCTFGGQPTSGARQSCRKEKPTQAPARPLPATERPPAAARGQ